MMSSSYENKNELSKSEIQSSISNCLTEIDPRYYSPSYNLMSEIVNVFGDIDFDKVKVDIDNLKEATLKLDQSIKLIVMKHSNEFYQILGFVREMRKMLLTSKEKYSYAEVSLDIIMSTMGTLIAGETNDWKLKSIFFAEVLSKLRKTQSIFELLHDCNSFLSHEKIYEAIDLLMKKSDEHQTFDKEFRQFNLLVNINLRFNKLNEDITKMLIGNINQIMVFNEENCLKSKIKSLQEFFISSYSKVSIDMEVTQPMIQFISIINQAVCYDLKEILDEGKNNSNINKSQHVPFHNKTRNSIENNEKPNSLIYLIKCLKRYNNGRVILKYYDIFRINLIEMFSDIIKILSEELKNLHKVLNDYDLNSKCDKMLFLVLIQIPLLICYHSLCKMSLILKHTPQCGKDKQLYDIYESVMLLPLNIIHKTVCGLYSPSDNQGQSQQSQEQSQLQAETDLYQLEILYKRKISDMSFITIDCLPIAYKIYYDYYQLCNEKLEVDFTIIKSTLSQYTKQLYKYFELKLCTKKYFDKNSFIYEYDTETSNFKFINEITTSINQLKRLLIFAFDSSYVDIMRIVKALFSKYHEDTKVFIEKQKKDCIHRTLFENLYQYLIKLQSDLISKVLIDFQYRKYENKIIQQKQQIPEKMSKVENTSLSLTEFVIDVARTTKQPDQLSLINRNYKLIELLTKFVSSTESALIVNENFIFDIMRQSLPVDKMTELLKNIGQIAFESIGSKDTNITSDLSSLFCITLTTFDNLSYELFKILLLLKIEYASLTIPLVKNLSVNRYALNEPQMKPEYFVTSFVNDLLMYNMLFQYNLNEAQYNFVKSDYMNIINDIFMYCIRNVQICFINHFGINLLVRDFEYIRDKLGIGYKFEDKKIEYTMRYFVNYAKLINANEDQFKEQLKLFNDVEKYNEEDIARIMQIRNVNQNMMNWEKNKNKDKDKGKKGRDGNELI